MNQTANLGLNLPEESDWAEVATLNENWEKVDEAVAKKAELGADGKIPAEQLPAMNYDPAGSAAAVQTNLTNHINNKNNPHGVTPGQIGAIPSSGGSVSGPLNFANSAWNNVGDDAAFGDRNVAGNFCVKGLNGAPGITLFTSDESQSYQVFGQHNLSLLMSQIATNGVPRITTGSYVGDGNYGQSSPNSINTGNTSKFLIVTKDPPSFYSNNQPMEWFFGFLVLLRLTCIHRLQMEIALCLNLGQQSAGIIQKTLLTN